MCNKTGALALSKGTSLWGTANASRVRWSALASRYLGYENTTFLLVPLPPLAHIRPVWGTVNSSEP